MFLVDTSVWSLAFRRDGPTGQPEVGVLRAALVDGEAVVTLGVILMELLRGFMPARARQVVDDQFRALIFVEPTRSDYIAAAGLSNTCRQAGVQLAIIDALIAQIAVAHDLTLLTTDRDFTHAARHIPLRVWGA